MSPGGAKNLHSVYQVNNLPKVNNNAFRMSYVVPKHETMQVKMYTSEILIKTAQNTE